MEIVTVMYIVVLSTFFFAGGIFVLAIAGKDILMAFQIFFNKKGSHVFVANTNRNIAHYYKTPKDDKFLVDKTNYITNPEKTMNLGTPDKDKVYDSLIRKKVRLHKKIEELKRFELDIRKQLLLVKDPKNKAMLMQQIKHYEGARMVFEAQLKDKQENYFFGKRPAFFYIQGDPIPKNFHEFYSALDCKIIDNLVSRGISTPPTQKVETDVKKLMLYVTVTLILAAVAAFLAFRNNGMMTEMCMSMGLACGL